MNGVGAVGSIAQDVGTPAAIFGSSERSDRLRRHRAARAGCCAGARRVHDELADRPDADVGEPPAARELVVSPG
jgi:hypothetical protein